MFDLAYNFCLSDKQKSQNKCDLLKDQQQAVSGWGYTVSKTPSPRVNIYTICT